MNVRAATLPGVLVIERRVFEDPRGIFAEEWRADAYRAAGLPEFVQDNVALSRRGVLRGLHYQHPRGQGKLVSVAAGAVFDVVVDIRRSSPTFGRWESFDLDASSGRQLWIPPGFAHGYLTLSEQAVFTYKCTEYYDPSVEGVVRWDDPAIGIRWPVHAPQVSAKDASAPALSDVARERLPE